MLRWVSALALWTVAAALVPMPPLSAKDPTSLGFAAISRQEKDKPLYDLLCFADKRKAFPTNHWWVPAVRPPSSIGKNYLVQLPYIYTVLQSGLEVYYPYVKGMANIVQNMLNEFGPSWRVGTGEGTGGTYCVQDADELTVTVNFGASMRSTIVRGSPYVTAHFQATTAELRTPLGIQKFAVDGVEQTCGQASPAGHVFTALLGNDEEWLIFTPPSTQVACSPEGLTIARPFSGAVRLALSNNCTTGKDGGRNTHCGPGFTSQVGEYKAALVKGSETCVSGAQVNIESGLEAIRNTITWRTEPCWAGPAPGPGAPIMMTALPHHLPLLDKNSVVVSGGGHRNARGHSVGVLTTGGSWALVLPHQPRVGWLGAPESSKISAITKAFKGRGNLSDVHYNLSRWAAQGMIDPYNGGKLIAKLATLVQIADALGDKVSKKELLGRVITHLSLWFDQRSKNRLVYDRDWGGVISCGCTYLWNDLKKEASCGNDGSKLECPTLQDPGYDFGNSMFNDHHFHYGYFIYSAAVAAKFDKHWAKKYNQQVLALVRDIANPSDLDPHFTTFRHFDWYVGHSWALGIVADANGRNQESSSEAVNAWYGMYLYGLATDNAHLSAVGNALMLMEAHSTNYYWHVKKSHAVYPPEYEHNIVGIVHEMLVEFQTFFGLRGFFVHGIQLIPITPMVNLMFQPDWVATAYPAFKQYCNGDRECSDSGFITFLYTEEALIDRESAWTHALQLPDHVFSDDCPGGNGNSRTALLHFIATYGKGARGAPDAAVAPAALPPTQETPVDGDAAAQDAPEPTSEVDATRLPHGLDRGTLLAAIFLVILAVAAFRSLRGSGPRDEQRELLAGSRDGGGGWGPRPTDAPPPMPLHPYGTS